MTIEKSQRIEHLKERAKRCCCRYCGGELHVRQIIFHTQADARVELYCDRCKKIEYGIEREIYEGARAFVQSTHFNHFPDMENNAQRLQMNVAKVCQLTNWQLRYLGFLSDEGFSAPLQVREYEEEQCTTIAESALSKLLEEAGQWKTLSSAPEE